MNWIRLLTGILSSKNRYSRALLLLLLAVLLLGPIGLVSQNLSKCAEPCSHVRLVLDSFVQTLKLFTPAAEVEGLGEDNWPLTIARLIGAFIAFGAIGGVIYRLFQNDIAAMRIRSLSGHMIICGFDEYAQKFAESCADKYKIVVIDNDQGDTVEPACQRLGHFFLKADADSVKVLDSAALERAAGLIVSAETDEHSIAICHAAAAHLSKQSTKPMETILGLNDMRLIDRMEHDKDFMREISQSLRLTLFNPARMTAISLCERTSFVEQALRRKQPCAHLIIIGKTSVAIETVIQFLRISPAIGLSKPRIDWLVDDTRELTGLLTQRLEALGALASQISKPDDPDPPLAWALDLHLHQLEPGSDLPQLELIKRIDAAKPGAVTAVIIATGEGSQNIAAAFSLRDRVNRRQLWQAPIYVHAPHETALDTLLTVFDGPLARDIPAVLAHLQRVEDPSEVIEPYGAIPGLCRLKTVRGQREEIARRIHEAYLDARQTGAVEEDISNGRDETLLSWGELTETYKQANRRAADHLPVKIESAGVQVESMTQPRRLQPERLNDEKLLEALAAIEHDSWRIDRELDGWRYAAVRDNKRKHHPDLVPYGQLPEETKFYDREQVKLLGEL